MTKKIILFASALLIPTQAYAVLTVSSPDVTEDLLQLESRFGYLNDETQRLDGALQQTYLADYGVNQSHALRLISRFQKPDGRANDLSSLGIEHRFQFMQKETNGWDAATRVHYKYNTVNGGADQIGADLLARFNAYDLIHTANINLDLDIGPHRESGVITALAWKSQKKLSEELTAGIEWYGDIGRLNQQSGINDQEHSIGPVLNYALTDIVDIETGYQLGLTDGATRGLFKLHFKASF